MVENTSGTTGAQTPFILNSEGTPCWMDQWVVDAAHRCWLVFAGVLCEGDGRTESPLTGVEPGHPMQTCVLPALGIKHQH